MNDIQEITMPEQELSHFLGNLFAELEPPCHEESPPGAPTITGRTAAGREATLFIGDPEDLAAARNGVCPCKQRCAYGG